MPLFVTLFALDGSSVTVSFEQALQLKKLKDADPHMVWHPNECGCCVSAHTATGDYVIGTDGEFDFYEKRQT